jgi:protein pelota
LTCDTAEDLWHLFNILLKGDFIKTITFRKVAHETSSGVKSTSVKKKINITLKIEEIEYDHNEGIIRYKGKNVSENEYIAIGQYQSIEIGKGSTFTVFKKSWDDLSIDKLRESCDVSAVSDLAAIVMEEGIANIFLISSHITTLKAKIESSIPKKRKGATGHDKSLLSFFQKILDSILKSINFDIVRCIIVASPGFTKDQFGNFLSDSTSNNKHYEIILKNMSKFIYVHSSSGYKQALQEVLSKPEILSQIKNTKAAEDINVMEKFNEILYKDMDRIVFGIKAVEKANEKEAIETLIVSDDYLRKIAPSKRKELTNIINKIKSYGADVVKMSSMHYTGEKINSFGGILAILRYAMPEINNEDIVDVEDIQEIHHHEEIEDGDQVAMDSLGGMENNHEEEKEDPEEELDEYDELSGKMTNLKLKNKGKPSKDEKKEREQNRKTAARKKSSFDGEI